MSGTLRALRQKRQQKEAAIRKAQQEQQRQQQLQLNRESIIAQICNTFGWSQLDDFALDMINKAVAGQLVDIEKLKQDLAEWKAGQENGNAFVSSQVN